jgi:hypothetical protein
MSKGPSTFRRNDVKRGIEAIEMTGKKVARIEIDKRGTIVLFPASGNTAADNNPWDGNDADQTEAR